MSHGTFGTAINCMDGRTQEPVAKYIRERYRVDYVDTITEPGPVKLLTSGSLPASIKTRVDISTGKHGSKVVAVVGHHDCAGNPVAKDVQVEQLGKAVALLRKSYPGVEVIGLWVGDDWQAVKVC